MVEEYQTNPGIQQFFDVAFEFGGRFEKIRRTVAAETYAGHVVEYECVVRLRQLRREEDLRSRLLDVSPLDSRQRVEHLEEFIALERMPLGNQQYFFVAHRFSPTIRP